MEQEELSDSENEILGSHIAKDSKYLRKMALVSLMHILTKYSSSSITTLFLKLIMGVNRTACCVVYNLLALNILVKLYPKVFTSLME